jgi:hypothetical protein
MRAVVWAVILLVLSAVEVRASGDLPPIPRGTLEVRPATVRMNLFYRGTKVDVRAGVPAGYSGAAVRLMGHAERLELKKKGKWAGVLWMSVGDVVFDDVPIVYQLITSAPLTDLAGPEVLAKWKLGYDALLVSSGGEPALREELVKLKAASGLFLVEAGTLREQKGGDQRVPGSVAAAEGGQEGAPAALRFLHGSFQLSPRAPAGDYVVDLIGFKNRRAFPLASVKLRVEYTGVVRALRELAMHHGLLYGVGAVVIAIVVGLLTGLVFDRKTDEGH